jgi:hypothetical protein
MKIWRGYDGLEIERGGEVREQMSAGLGKRLDAVLRFKA